MTWMQIKHSFDKTLLKKNIKLPFGRGTNSKWWKKSFFHKNRKMFPLGKKMLNCNFLFTLTLCPKMQVWCGFFQSEEERICLDLKMWRIFKSEFGFHISERVSFNSSLRGIFVLRFLKWQNMKKSWILLPENSF